MSTTNNPIPTYKTAITQNGELTNRAWYFFFQSLYNKFAGVITSLTSTSMTVTNTNGAVDIELKASGVTSGAYTNTNLTVNADGIITAAANGTSGGGTGTVTSVGLTSTGSTIAVTGASPITTSGTFNVDLPASGVTAGSYTSTNITVNAKGIITAAATGGGSSSGTPGTIKDLVAWFDASQILGTNGQSVIRLGDRTPWVGGLLATTTGAGIVSVGATQLNGLNVLAWPASSGFYSLISNLTFPQSLTIFVVVIPQNSGTPQAIVGGSSSALALYLGNGTANLTLVKAGVAVVGTSTTAWTAGTAFQANATYTSSSGVYAFRQSQAAAGSGTGATGMGVGPTAYIGADGGTSDMASSSLAELILYDRMLSPAEITSVETYLNTKWGV